MYWKIILNLSSQSRGRGNEWGSRKNRQWGRHMVGQVVGGSKDVGSEGGGAVREQMVEGAVGD